MGLFGKSRTCIGCGETFRGLVPWTKYHFTGKDEDKKVCICNECMEHLPVSPKAPLDKVPWRIIETNFADSRRRLSEHPEFQVTYSLKNFRLDEEHGLFQLGGHGKIFHVSELDGYKFMYQTEGKGEFGNLIFCYRKEGEHYYDENARKSDILRFNAGSLISAHDEKEEVGSLLFNEVIITHYYSEPFPIQQLRWRFDAMCAYFGVPIDEKGSGVEQIIWECLDYYLRSDGKMVKPKTVEAACKQVKKNFGGGNAPRYAAEIEMVYQSVLDIAAVKGEYERRFR